MIRYDFIIKNETTETDKECLHYNEEVTKDFIELYNKNNTSQDSSSSEEEPDQFEIINPLIREDELKNLTMYIDQPLLNMKPILKMFDNRMSAKIVPLLNPLKFFVDENEKKIPFLMSLPYSYLPLIKKPLESRDPICAPSYMNEEEVKEYTRPFYIDLNYYGLPEEGGKGGMCFKYDLEKRKDDQSNYVFYQRQFYGKIMKDRLVNGNHKEKKSKGNNAKAEEDEKEYNLPMTLYEPVSFLKRFCDVFYYLNKTFGEMVKRDDEELMLKKFMSGLIAGFHRSLASQGLPIGVLIGETYEVESTHGEFKLFAEVKNDKPIKIAYNIRWKKRVILLDGYTEFTYEFKENKDAFILAMTGYNKLKLQKKDKSYKIFEFSLPESVSFRNIVDDDEKERTMTVDGYMYIRGDLLSSITAFNYFKSTNLFNSFYGLINRKIINYDKLQNGHSFIGLIFHNSGFSFAEYKDGERFNDFFITKKKDHLDQYHNKADQTNEIADNSNRIVGFTNYKDIDKSFIRDESRLIFLEEKAGAEMFDLKKKMEYKDKAIDFGKEKPKEEGPKKSRNINPYSKRIVDFLNVCHFMARVSKKSSFITCFADSFIFKIFIGSFAGLNFFEINHNVTTQHSLNAFFLLFDAKEIKSRPFSDYNPKAGIMLRFDDYRFFKNPKKLYTEDFWKPVKTPLNTDTRFREDVLWLMRYHQLMAIAIKKPVYDDKQNTDKLNADMEAYEELEKKRLDAFINAGRWRELLEAYTSTRISKRINEKGK
jgi:hypothetical protein